MSPRSRRVIAASAAFAATLALLVRLALMPEAASRNSDAGPAPRQAVDPRVLEPVEAYAAIAERPLFQPSRRPAIPLPLPAVPPAVAAAAAPPPAPPAPPPTLPPMILLAVAISADKREAVLGLAAGKTSTMAEGESLDGWVLIRVLPDRVVFRQAETQKEIGFPASQTAVRPAPPHRLTNPSPPAPRSP